jgi:hypothetical protein
LGEAEKFLSPAGILGYAARGLVIVREKKVPFLYMMSHWLWSFHSRAMCCENRIRILFGQLTHGGLLVNLTARGFFLVGIEMS